MWSLKAHYCLWFGALSGILPYVSVFAKTHLGVSATAVGLLYAILPLTVSVIKPIACSAADHFARHSEALLVSQAFTLVGYGALLAIPFTLQAGLLSAHSLWYCFCALAFVANTAMGVGISLTDYLVMHEVANERTRGVDTNFGVVRIWGTIGFGIFGILSGVINEQSSRLPYLLPGLLMFIAIEALDIVCIYRFYHLPIVSQRRESAAINDGDDDEDEDEDEDDRNHQVSPQSQIGENLNTLIDDEQTQPYRSTTTDDISSSPIPQPSFIIRFQRGIKDATAIAIATVSQICRLYYRYPALIQYTIVVFSFGILTALHWSFFFWFLEDIRGPDSLLMGLCIFVNSFVGEIPVFLVAYRIIARIGPALALCVSLSAFAVRYFCYGFWLEKADGKYWDVLLIETLQGLTFSLFYTVMTYVAAHYADKCDRIAAFDTRDSGNTSGDSRDQLGTEPPQTTTTTTASRKSSIDDEVERVLESNFVNLRNTAIPSARPDARARSSVRIAKPSATMQGLMSACYEGAGLGVGSLLGGILIDHFSKGAIWRIAGAFSAALVAVNLIIEFAKWFHHRRSSKSLNRSRA